MEGFSTLFNLGMKKRIKDSFFITYGIVFPTLLILIVGYMTSNFYSGEEGISSYYYYTMVTIPFCTFLQAVTLIYIAREESNNKCGERFIIAPIGKVSVVLSKIIPSTITITIYNLVLMVICKLVLGVDFRGRMLELLILYFSLGFMSCAIGTFIGLSAKDFMAVKNFVSTPVLIMALLGGSFFPIGSLGKIVETVSNVSPLNWVNRGIFMFLNDGESKTFLIAIVITFILGIFFTIYSVRKFNKEVFL
jgi:ABC-2 type transport system permease protein